MAFKLLGFLLNRCWPKRRRQHNSGTNNLPPILFHPIHGDNIRLSDDRTVATRVDYYCKGICFSDRPIRINERVCIKFNEISKSWSGAIRFGFTSNDPIDHLPEYTYPGLTNKTGNWVTGLGEKFAIRDYVLFFYVTELGVVHYGINGEERGIFFIGGTNCPLWALIDIYGKTVSIESVDPQQVNCRRNNYEIENIIPRLSTIDINRDNRESSPHECTVCYEQPINSAIYMCGHVCMCYDCALKQWRGPGQCPICRAAIKDVIRTYYS